jgi:hypothetical protein
MVDALRNAGWKIDLAIQTQALPSAILSRYPWFPNDYREFAEAIENAVGPGEKVWLLTSADYSKNSDSGFAWNERETQSLEAAENSEHWKASVGEPEYEETTQLADSVKDLIRLLTTGDERLERWIAERIAEVASVIHQRHPALQTRIAPS